MATTTGPDLTAARERVELQMDDTGTIVRDSSGTRDDAIDTVTGQLIPPASDTTTVYDESTLGDGGRTLGGRCAVTGGRGGTIVNRGGHDSPETGYRLLLPWDAPMPQVGDRFTCLTSRRDPQLPGRTFVIRAVKVGTYHVFRRCEMELRG